MCFACFGKLAACRFYPRWKEYEASQAQLLEFSLEEGQWEEDWAGLLSLASQPGSSLEQLHVFALAHILRRPIIVYGVKYVKSFRGEAIGYARFEGMQDNGNKQLKPNLDMWDVHNLGPQKKIVVNVVLSVQLKTVKMRVWNTHFSEI